MQATCTWNKTGLCAGTLYMFHEAWRRFLGYLAAWYLPGNKNNKINIINKINKINIILFSSMVFARQQTLRALQQAHMHRTPAPIKPVEHVLWSKQHKQWLPCLNVQSLWRRATYTDMSMTRSISGISC
jgi:hypothetical protein